MGLGLSFPGREDAIRLVSVMMRPRTALTGALSRLGQVRNTDRSTLIVILTVLMFATIPVVPRLFDELLTPDESMLIVYPDRILSGQWPNRDFFNNAYGPGQFWLLAGAFKVFGTSVVTERLTGWLLHCAIAFGVVRIAWPRGRFVAGIAGCTSAFILAFLGLPAFAWLGALSLAVWSIGVLTGRGARGAFVVAGLMVALVFLFRPDLGPAAVICQVPLLWRSRFKLFWVLGLGLGAVPMVVHLTLAGPEFLDNVRFIMGRTSTGVAMAPDTSALPRVAAPLLVVSVLALVWKAVRKRDPVLSAVTALSILLLPQAFQRLDLTHIAYVGCFIWPMWFTFVFIGSPAARGLIHRYGAEWLRRCLSVTAVILLGTTIIMVGSTWRQTFWLTHLDRSMPLRDPRAVQEHQALIAALNARVPRGEPIFVGAVDMSVLNYSPMYLYYLLPEYRPAGYYLELPGGFGDVGKALSKDIRGAGALLLSDAPELQRSQYRSGWRGPADADNAVAKHFCQVGRYGHILLYTRCGSR
jgi:hypothetical protein